jgi:hypothetical protein
LDLTATGWQLFKAGDEPWSTDTLFFSGKIDDIHVYDKEMGPADIQALFKLATD